MSTGGDILKLREDQIELRSDLASVRGSLHDLSAHAKDIDNRIPALVDTAVNAKIRSVLSIVTGTVFAGLFIIITSMWSFKPIRLYIVDKINYISRFDEYIALLIENDKSISNYDTITTSFRSFVLDLRKDADFNKEFDELLLNSLASSYVKNNSLHKNLPLSVSYPITIKYQPNTDSYSQIPFFYAEDRDLYINCQLDFKGTIPEEVYLLINGQRFETSSTYTVNRYQVPVKRHLKPDQFMNSILTPGRNQLVVAVKALERVSDDEIVKSSAGGGCWVATSGVVDAAEWTRWR